MSDFVINFDKINEESEAMAAESTSEGKVKYFGQSKIPVGGEQNMRLLPPLRSLNGLFYLVVQSVWVNGKNYISPRTFNKPCPMMDFIDEVNKSGDAALKALLDAVKPNSTSSWPQKIVSVSKEYWMNALLLDVEYKNRELVKCEIVNEEAVIFKCSWTVIKQINSKITHPQYQNGTPLGVFDREKGFNIIVSKDKTKGKTSYDVMGWTAPLEMPEEYYADVLDLAEYTEGRIYSTEYLEGVIGNYFYGDPMPADDLKWIHRPQSESKPKEDGIPKATRTPVTIPKAATVAPKAKRTPKAVTPKVPKATEEADTPADTAPTGLSLMQRLKQNK